MNLEQALNTLFDEELELTHEKRMMLMKTMGALATNEWSSGYDKAYNNHAKKK